MTETYRGAPMGRPSTPPGFLDPKYTPPRIYLRRVRLDRGGYDSAGCYWGIGAPLYEASSEDGEWTLYLRAASRAEAKAKAEEREGRALRWFR